MDLRLPHELQLGTHIRDISVSLAAMRSFLQGTKEHSSKNKSRALDVILSLTTVTVRACLPPWEAWLSSHSKALSSARSGILIMDHAREAGEASLQGLSQPWRGRSVPTTEPSAAAGAGLSTIPNADTACLEWRLYRGAKVGTLAPMCDNLRLTCLSCHIRMWTFQSECIISRNF